MALGSSALCALAAATTLSGAAQAAENRAILTGVVDDSKLVEVAGNIRPEVRTSQDLGRIDDSTFFPHVTLVLQRSGAMEKATQDYIEAIHNKNSPLFHHWLSPSEITEKFGPAPEDRAKIEAWLTSHGMKVNFYTPNLALDVSATAAQLRTAFGLEVHNFMVKGERHMLSITNPSVPEALRPVLMGPMKVSDLRPHSNAVRHHKGEYTFTSSGETTYALVPQDLETIYNITPLYSQGLSGQGMTMVVVEDSDLYTNGDWYTFRKTLGLTRAFPYGNLVVSHPTVGTLTGDGSATCTDPGDNSADGEAAIDVEWSSAVAPNATIVMATCKDVGTAASGFGGFLALQNLETEVGHPNVVSISYGESEEITGATSNAYINTLYQTAVLEGISVFVSSGDDGASSSDRDATKGATHGINVTGWGSSQYVTSVGGTDFEDGYLNDYGQYWNTTNTSKFGSAKSYIPEIPWNDTCASALFLAYIQANDPGLGTFTNVYGSGGLCNNSVLVSDDYEETGGGSGGPSNCATGAATISETYSGTCAGWPKPSYQTGIVGNPSDGVRDLPDVALMASNGFWGHYYITCYSHTAYEGVACGPTVSAWAGYGGTSVSTPIMAAIQLLVNQKTGQSWGNANYTYYAIAKSQYGASGNPACNSSAAGGPSASCDFNDITAGDMADACAPQFSSVRSGRTTTYTYVGTFNCFGSSYTEVNNTTAPVLTYGVLSTNNTGPSPTPAYGTNTGWDFATGIGSVNATTLVNDPAWLQP